MNCECLRIRSIACSNFVMKISCEHSMSQFCWSQQVSESCRSSTALNVPNGTEKYPRRNFLAIQSHHLHLCRHFVHSYAMCSEYRLQFPLFPFPSSFLHKKCIWGEPPSVWGNFWSHAAGNKRRNSVTYLVNNTCDRNHNHKQAIISPILQEVRSKAEIFIHTLRYIVYLKPRMLSHLNKSWKWVPASRSSNVATGIAL